MASDRPSPPDLSSFGSDLRVAVVGASGGIGRAFCEALASSPHVAQVWAAARNVERIPDHDLITPLEIDLEDEATIEAAAKRIADDGYPISLVIVAAGFLHDDTLGPEKTWRKLSAASFERNFAINTIGPSLVAKHVVDLLDTERKSVFAALSARVGSISDNRAGGWHAYRASKAALNMVIKTLSVELARRNPHAACIGLHPGTVETQLSAPFRRNVPAEKLFTPVTSAAHLLHVIDGISVVDSGGCFAWDGQRIEP